MSTQHEDSVQERIYNQIIANIKILERFINTKCFFNLDKIERTVNELILLRRHCELKHCQEIDSTFYKISKILNKEQLDRIFKKIFQYKKDVLKDKLLLPILENPSPQNKNQKKPEDDTFVESIENLKRQRERTEKNRMTRRAQGYLNSKQALQNRREQQKRKDTTQREKRIAQRKQQQQLQQQPQQPQLQEKKPSLFEKIFPSKKGGSLRKNIKHHNKTSRHRNKQTRRRRQK
jgi:hypothetical protein